MLTPQQKADAEKRLKFMEIQNLKDDPKAQRNLLNLLSSKIGSQSMALQKLARGFENAEQKMKQEKNHMNKQKLLSLQQKQKIQISIEQIKDTIKKIKETVASSIKDQADKRQKISDDLQKSLGQIKQKIVTFEIEAKQMEVQNQTLRAKKKQIQQKMANLQINFKQKAQEKDNEVKKQKEQLMVKLQTLESEVSEVTEINKELSGIQKNNFDKKLSLYLKTKKFPEFSTSFQNSAKTIDQCKQQIFKGVQRMNDAKETIQKCQKQAKQLGNNYLAEYKKKSQKQSKIDSVKKQKQTVRQRIISLQNKLKQKKNKAATQ